MPTRLDWRGWRHGPVVGPLHAGVGLAAVAAVGDLPAVGLPVSWVAVTGALGAGVTALRSRTPYANLSRLGLAARLAAWTVASGWVGWVLTAGWSPAAVFTLGAGSVLGGVAARLLAPHEQHVQAVRRQRAAAAKAAAEDHQEQEELHGLAEAWVARIRRICKRNVQILAIEHWRFPGEHGTVETGYTLEVLLPTDGTTIETLSSYANALATAADLPEGCGVEFLRSTGGRRRVLILVNTRDALRDELPLPLASGPQTLNDPIDLGVLRNGSKALILLRYVSALLVGMVGSGKSNMLQTLIARLLECGDVLVCVIDYNGGGIALDWLAEWAQGRARKPAILWVADNPEEAALLTGWLIAGIEHRKRAYAAENRARDDDKIAISPRVPQIVLVTDEVAAVSARLQEQIVQISNRGRAAAIRAITCSLRATAAGVSRDIAVQAEVRLGMRMSDVNEIAYMFGWLKAGARPTPADAPEAGYAFVGAEGETVRVAKAYRTSPSTIAAVARATDNHRPDLDESTLNMSPEWRQIFMDRWKRSPHILQAAAGGAVPAGAGTSPGPASSSSGPAGAPGQRAELPPLPPPNPGGMKGALDDLADAEQRLRDAAGRGPAAPGDQEAFDAIVAGLDGGLVPEIVVTILAAMDGVDRMHTATIAAVIGARKETLGQLLSKLDIRPLRNAFRVDGQDGRGYERAAVEAAAERIRAGQLRVPPEVAAWTRTTP